MWVGAVSQQRDGRRDGGDRVRGAQRQRRGGRGLAARARRRRRHHRRPPQPLRPAPQVAARLPRAGPIGGVLAAGQEEASDVSASIALYSILFFLNAIMSGGNGLHWKSIYVR